MEKLKNNKFTLLFIVLLALSAVTTGVLAKRAYQTDLYFEYINQSK